MKLNSYTNRMPAWLYVVCFLLICVLVGWVGGKAISAPASQSIDQKLCSFKNSDGGCWFGPDLSAQKFKNGYFDKSNGFPKDKVFKDPAAAKDAFVAKIKARVGGLTLAHKQDIAAHFGMQYANGKRALARTIDVVPYVPGCTDYCLAWHMYGELMSDGNCAGYGPPTDGSKTCTFSGNTSITKQGVQNFGMTVICGVTVGIGVAAAPETLGGGTVAAAGFMGVLGCGWGLWMAVD